MKSTFMVVEPGLLTTVQDRGRFGYRAYGMPSAGAVDPFAYRIANMLVGNSDDAAALECTLVGPILKVHSKALVALCGANMQITLNGSPMPLWQAVYVHPGDTIDVGHAQNGARAYMAVAGGFDVPVVMGSRSTYLRARIGGFHGRALMAGDILTTADFDERHLDRDGLKLPDNLRPHNAFDVEIRVVWGPQQDLFTENSMRVFVSSTYVVTTESDRMGCRLNGPLLQHKNVADIVSDGVIPGSIQVPGQGMPIVLLSDAQTTGGYPKIATVITADLWKLGQATTGTHIRFKAINRDEALNALREHEASIIDMANKFVQAIPAAHYKVRIENNCLEVRVREA